MRRPVVVGAEHRDRRAGLGQTVGVDETHIRQQFQRPADQWQTHLGAAISEVAQRWQLRSGVARLEHGDDAVQHGRDHGGGGDLFVVDQPHPLLRVEVGQVDHLSAGVQVRQRRADPGDVIGRHADQRGIGRRGRLEFDRAGDVAGQVVVGEFDGLGLRRGARGEQHDGQRIRVGELGGGLRDLGRCQKFFGGRQPIGGVPDHVLVAAVDDHQRLGQPVDQGLDAVRGQAVVDRGEGQPGARRREDQHRQHRERFREWRMFGIERKSPETTAVRSGLLDAAISRSNEILTRQLSVVSSRYKARQKCHAAPRCSLDHPSICPPWAA